MSAQWCEGRAGNGYGIDGFDQSHGHFWDPTGVNADKPPQNCICTDVEPEWSNAIEGVIYAVTVESPDHKTYEFTSWDSQNPYSAAMDFFAHHSSYAAKITEQYVRRTEPRQVAIRGYYQGGADEVATALEPGDSQP